MFKKSLIFYFFFIIVISVYAEDSSDYFLGISAYKDGFYDVAEISLKDYLKNAEDKDKILFANYLLYKINFKKKNFDEALKYIEKIEKTNDKRINMKNVKADKLFIYSLTDCESAKKYLNKNFYKETLAVYLKTKCNVDKSISDRSLKLKLKNNLRLLLALKLENSPDDVEKQFLKMNLKKLGNKYKKFFAIYFYKNKKFDNFWKIYNIFKDDELVNLALERVWNLKKYDSFLKSFEMNRKHYSVDRINYCRAYEVYKKIGKKVDCSLLDKCFKKKDGKYYKAKLSCYQENNDKDNFKTVFFQAFEKYRDIACEFGVYGYDTGNVGLDNLKKCSNRNEIAEQLIAEEKGKAVLLLLSKDNSDKGKYYKVLAYLLLGDTASAEKVFNSIKDKTIKDELLKLIK